MRGVTFRESVEPGGIAGTAVVVGRIGGVQCTRSVPGLPGVVPRRPGAVPREPPVRSLRASSMERSHTTRTLRVLRDHVHVSPQPAAQVSPGTKLDRGDAPGLPASEIQHFKEHGFVVARGLLREHDFDDLIAAYDALITQRARPLFEAGLLSSLHEDAPFHKRLAALRADPQLPLERRGDLTAEIDIYQARCPEMFEFFFNKRLLAGVSSIIGPEITLSPIQHIRPFCGDGENVATGPQWHMDQAVTLEEADASEIVTCWIPFVDTFPENGCLQFVDGLAPESSWRRDRPNHLTVGHHASPHVRVQDRAEQQLEVPAAFLQRLGKSKEDVKVVEAVMQKGDVLLFNAYVPHRGGVNSSLDLVSVAVFPLPLVSSYDAKKSCGTGALEHGSPLSGDWHADRSSTLA